ncbi:hypothetical protein VTO42DRAFT_9035 [Malbranchea cinnamomea]
MGAVLCMMGATAKDHPQEQCHSQCSRKRRRNKKRKDDAPLDQLILAAADYIKVETDIRRRRQKERERREEREGKNMKEKEDEKEEEEKEVRKVKDGSEDDNQKDGPKQSHEVREQGERRHQQQQEQQSADREDNVQVNYQRSREATFVYPNIAGMDPLPPPPVRHQVNGIRKFSPSFSVFSARFC